MAFPITAFKGLSYNLLVARAGLVTLPTIPSRTSEGLASEKYVKYHELLNKGLSEGMQPLSCTHPEDDVVTEEQVLVPAADLSIGVSIIVHLPRSRICGETWEP